MIIVMEEECRSCYGGVHRETCESCDSTGMRLTEVGREIFDVVTRHIDGRAELEALKRGAK